MFYVVALFLSLCTVDLRKLIKVYNCGYKSQTGRVVENMCQSENLDFIFTFFSFPH